MKQALMNKATNDKEATMPSIEQFVFDLTRAVLEEFTRLLYEAITLASSEIAG